jgi:hypothetical protein
MNRRVAICFSCVSLLCLGFSGHAPSRTQEKVSAPDQGPASAPAQFAYGGDAAQIPAEFIGNVALLPVRFNQSRSSLFVLDSTASTSSIDPSRLSALGVSATESPVLNLNGVDLSFATLPAMLREDIGPRMGRAYEGTLGTDFFQRVVVEIDYARQSVRLYDPASYKYAGEGTALRLNFAAGLPVISAKFTNLKGRLLEGNFAVSTALDASTVLFDRYAESHHIFSSHWKTIRSVDPALNGSGGAVVGRLGGMQLGRYTAQGTLVTFSGSDLPGTSDPQVAGLIGAGLLSRFTVIFDYPHQQIIVAPNSHFLSDEQEDKSGISVVAKGSALRTFEIVEVTPGTPAAKAGVQKGDIIAGIDEDPAADLSLAEIRDLFRQIGHKYTLVIDRNGQSKKITVEMRRQI